VFQLPQHVGRWKDTGRGKEKKIERESTCGLRQEVFIIADEQPTAKPAQETSRTKLLSKNDDYYQKDRFGGFAVIKPINQERRVAKRRGKGTIEASMEN